MPLVTFTRLKHLHLTAPEPHFNQTFTYFLLNLATLHHCHLTEPIFFTKAYLNLPFLSKKHHLHHRRMKSTSSKLISFKDLNALKPIKEEK